MFVKVSKLHKHTPEGKRIDIELYSSNPPSKLGAQLKYNTSCFRLLIHLFRVFVWAWTFTTGKAIYESASNEKKITQKCNSRRVVLICLMFRGKIFSRTNNKDASLHSIDKAVQVFASAYH